MKVSDFIKSTVLLMGAASAFNRGTKKPKPRKPIDRERMEAAEAKRQRKALKRLRGKG